MSETNTDNIRIILASGSPRRRELLEDAGVDFIVRIPRDPVDETLTPDELMVPEEAAKQLAQKKAGAVLQELLAEEGLSGTYVILGADTMVVYNGEIFGKPRFIDDAKRMLCALSGDTHKVITAVSVWMLVFDDKGEASIAYRTFADTSEVTFKSLTDKQVDDYLKLGESFDKAGAYAIQGAGADLIDHYEGAFDNIVGLPVGHLLSLFPDLLKS